MNQSFSSESFFLTLCFSEIGWGWLGRGWGGAGAVLAGLGWVEGLAWAGLGWAGWARGLGWAVGGWETDFFLTRV